MRGLDAIQRACIIVLLGGVATLAYGQKSELFLKENTLKRWGLEVYLGAEYGFDGTISGEKEFSFVAFEESEVDTLLLRKAYDATTQFDYTISHQMGYGLGVGMRYSFNDRLYANIGAELSRNQMTLTRTDQVSISSVARRVDTVSNTERSTLCDPLLDYVSYPRKTDFDVVYLSIPIRFSGVLMQEKWTWGAGLRVQFPVFVRKQIEVRQSVRSEVDNEIICDFITRKIMLPNYGSIRRVILSGTLSLDYAAWRQWTLGVYTNYYLGDIFTPEFFKGGIAQPIPFRFLGVKMGYRIVG